MARRFEKRLVAFFVLALFGVIGFGANAASAEPLSQARQVAAGDNHTCALSKTGQVSCWGNNATGQLGDGTTTNSTTPVSVKAVDGHGKLSRVKQIAVGDTHSCALLTNGRVSCWGNNATGQLGDGTTTNSTTPVLVKAVDGHGELARVKQIATGAFHTCALLANGRVNCWGNNASSQLGDGTMTDRTTPAPVGAINGQGDLTRVRQIASHRRHSCALLISGRVACWGDNREGQLGDGTTADSATPAMVKAVGGQGDLTRVKQIATGAFHSCAVRSNSRSVCWGNNEVGQLGIGTTAARSTTPVAVKAVNGQGELARVKRIATGDSHSCAVLVNGKVNCWGWNLIGQLGDGTTVTSPLPIAVSGAGGEDELTKVKHVSLGSAHSCALQTDGRVNCWGNNHDGQLGDGTTTSSTTPVRLPAEMTNVKQIAAGAFHSCALLSNGGVNCWGTNVTGELGNGTTGVRSAPVAVLAVGGEGTLTGVKQLSAGGYQTCALLTGGRVNCWGNNDYGQLGDGTTTSRSTPVAVKGLGGSGELTNVRQIAAGLGHTCALLTNGRVACWGVSSFGQLGDGSTTNRTTPVMVKGIGGEGHLTRVKQVDAGDSHSCALLASGRVNCWGYNGEGQLGNGEDSNSAVPVAVKSTDGRGELTKVKQLAAGYYHSCAVLTSDRVKCWGDNLGWPLGNEINYTLLPVSVVGSDSEGELTRAKHVAAGGSQSCAVLANGRANCWGTGPLGDGNETDSAAPVEVKGIGGQSELTKVKQISSGWQHSCLLLLNGRVNCWGDNWSGQLGDGSSTGSTTLVGVVSGL